MRLVRLPQACRSTLRRERYEGVCTSLVCFTMHWYVFMTIRSLRNTVCLSLVKTACRKCFTMSVHRFALVLISTFFNPCFATNFDSANCSVAADWGIFKVSRILKRTKSMASDNAKYAADHRMPLSFVHDQALVPDVPGSFNFWRAVCKGCQCHVVV